MRIRIHSVPKLRLLLRQTKQAKIFKLIIQSQSSESEENQSKTLYKGFIQKLDNKIPYNYKKTALSNGLSKFKAFEPGLITGIIYVILNDYRYPVDDDNSIGYKPDHLQMFFAHLDKEDIKSMNPHLPAYKELVEKLSGEDHPFGKISLNDNWKLEGKKCINIDDYINQIQDKSIVSPKDVENDINETFWNTKNKSSLFQKAQTPLAYFFSLLVLVSFISIPVISIGIYKTKKEFKNRKVKVQRYIFFSLAILINLFYNAFVVFKLVDTSAMDYESWSFEAMETKNGIVTLHNDSESKGTFLQERNKLVAKLGDTITLSARVRNATDASIENVKVEFSPKNSGNAEKHTLYGKISGFGVETVYDYAEVKTPVESYLKNLKNSFIQIDGGTSDLMYLDESEHFSLFSGGFRISDVLYPGSEEDVTISSQFVVERREQQPAFAFHSDPAGTAYGFTTINKRDQSDNFNVSIPNLGDYQVFKVYINYRNYSKSTVVKTEVNARSGISYYPYGYTSQSPIYGWLTSDYEFTQCDLTRLGNLPESGWQLELIDVKSYNLHSEDCEIDYSYESAPNNGVELLEKRLYFLPELDSEGIDDNGYLGVCSQGYVEALFKITNGND